ncbi:hypothetical protein NW759_17766 [Fusarium solani]|nr:hypothetical protein NW759_17766 [Fusarium solani]
MTLLAPTRRSNHVVSSFGRLRPDIRVLDYYFNHCPIIPSNAENRQSAPCPSLDGASTVTLKSQDYRLRLRFSGGALSPSANWELACPNGAQCDGRLPREDGAKAPIAPARERPAPRPAQSDQSESLQARPPATMDTLPMASFGEDQ